MLYLYGLKTGIQSILRMRLSKETIRNLVIPVNYWRTLEYKIVFEELQPNNDDRILDIGSPKLLSLYLAEMIGSDIFSVDIDDYFVDDYSFFRKIKGIQKDRFHVMIDDGRKLSFKDNFFSKIYSISAIEHIPENGDTDCMKQIERVLVDGGKCVITVPFSPIGKEEYRKVNKIYWAKSYDSHDGIFYQRRYDEKDLYERLILPSKLHLCKLQFIGETVFKNSNKEFSDLLYSITGHIQPLLSHLFLTKPVDSWKELDKPLAALIVLEKRSGNIK